MNERYQWFLLGCDLYRWEAEGIEMVVRQGGEWIPSRESPEGMKRLGAIGPHTKAELWDRYLKANQYPYQA